ncbi:MAG: hypothetical protein JWM68_2328 [Verrucomicrobiales bacterium]|nr:hypothetical protein [Verrucomicrobiales bacterium]
METADLRSKEEIKADIEQNRHQVRSQYRRTKTAVVEQNPAVLAWQATKRKFSRAKAKSVLRAREADISVRSNVYRTLAFAAIAGVLVGLFAPRKRKIVVYKEL